MSHGGRLEGWASSDHQLDITDTGEKDRILTEINIKDELLYNSEPSAAFLFTQQYNMDISIVSTVLCSSITFG